MKMTPSEIQLYELTPTSSQYIVSKVGATATSIRALDEKAVSTGGFASRAQMGMSIFVVGAAVTAGMGLFTPHRIEQTVPTMPAADRSTAPKRDHDESPSPALMAFTDLASWLDASDAEIANMVGIGRTTPYAWKRNGSEPQAAKTRKLYELHSTFEMVRHALDPDGFRTWIHYGNPSRLTRVLTDGLQSIDRDIHELLFSSTELPDLSWAPETTGNETSI